MRAAFRSQRHTGWGSSDDESRARIGAIDKGIQTTANKRVIDGADGQQRLIRQVPRQAELTQQQKEVHLRDTQLNVLALWMLTPLQHRVVFVPVTNFIR